MAVLPPHGGTPRELPLTEHRGGFAPVAGSPGPSAAPSDGPDFEAELSEEDAERRRFLVNSALSDDGRTPLIRAAAQPRRLQLAAWARVAGRFVLASWSKFLILGVIVTLIVLVSVKGIGIFGEILGWFKNHNGWAGWGAFLGMYTGIVALFLPGVVFIMGAGFVFGFWRGLLAVWVGGSVGQALAFLLARYLLKDWVEVTVKRKWKSWQYIDKAIEYDGWKLVLIMRFSPIIPYNLLNIAMATTPMPFLAFAIVSAVGIVFECAIFCYFGSMADGIGSIVSGSARPAAIEWVLLGISVVMCVAGAVLVSYSLKRAVRRAQYHMSMADLEREAVDGEAAELGVALDATFLQALQREGFARTPPPLDVGGLGALASAGSSPEFELRAVRSGSIPIRGDRGGGAGFGASARPSPSSLGTGSAAQLRTQLSSSNSGKAKVSPPPADHSWAKQQLHQAAVAAVVAPQQQHQQRQRHAAGTGASAEEESLLN